MTVALIIPAYNEEQRLRPFLQSIVDFTADHPNAIQEILVVDDGSTDTTVQVAQSCTQQLPQIRVIQHEKNRGKGAAVQTGVLAATSDYVIFIDADGATPITELPNMVAALAQAQIAVGNRWMPGAKTLRHSTLRQLAGWAYRTYMSLFGLGSIDTMCGFKGYRREVARTLFAHLIEERWLFDTEVAYKAVRAGYTIKNFPISWESKDGSKLDAKTLLTSALHIWPLITKIKSEIPQTERN